MNALLELEDFGLRYRHGAPLFTGLNLSLAAGQCLAVLGASGCGKSSLAAALIGLAPNTAEISGRLRFAGQQVGLRDERAWRRLRGRRIGFVFQDAALSLHPLLRIETQLAELLPSASERQAALAEVGLNAQSLGRRYPHQLSGGQRQRVMIALALALSPELLICDEPTSALDSVASAGVLSLLARLRSDRGLAVILISHDLDAAAGIADRLLVLEPGRVAVLGSTASLLGGDPAPALAKLLRPARLFRHESAPRQQAVTAGAAADTESRPIIELSGLHVAYGARQVLEAIDVELPAGQTLGVIGNSGSGKSTLARALLRLVPASASRFLVAGLDPRDLRGAALKRWRQTVQIVLQDPATALDPEQTVAAAIGEALDLHRLCGSPAERRVRIDELLAAVQLPSELAVRYPAELSGGQQQRVAIARALAVSPRLLVCDEAVSALDLATQTEILDLLALLRARQGLSLVFIAHDLAAIGAIADRLLVIEAGRLVESGPTQEVLARPKHQATRALIAALPARLGAQANAPRGNEPGRVPN